MTVQIAPLPFRTDAGIASRARLGLVCLASDYTIEHEFQLVLRHLPGVALHVARILNDPTITPQSLADMEARLSDTAKTLLPGDTLDAIAYGCTSASMVMGPNVVARRVQSAKPGVTVTNPISSAIKAFEAFGARRIGVLTPYTADVNAGIQRFLQDAGFEVPVFGSFNEPSDIVVAKITPASLHDAIMRVRGAAEMDAIFVSCTAIRLLDQIEALEQKLSLPVTSSNQALIWQTLRQAGIADAVPGLGRLFRLAE